MLTRSPPPPFSFWSLPHLPAEGGREGENKCVVHSGHCRPLCGLCILALFKFRVVCSGSHTSSIRWLFRAHAGPGSSTAHSLTLAPAKLCLQMTSSPGFPHLEAVLLLGPWVPNPTTVFPTSPSQLPCCVLHTF